MKRSTRGSGLLEPMLARWRHRRAFALLADLPSKEAILDLGCGQYPVFLELLPFARKVGIDRAPPHPQLPRSITMVQHNLATNHLLPFPEASFDAVTMLATLEHLPPSQALKLLGEVHRVLRTGGRFVFTTPHRLASPVLRLLTQLHMVSREEIAEHHTLFTKPMLLQALTAAHFPPPSTHLSSFQCGLNLCGYAQKE